MNINTNNSDERVEGSDLYTGIFTVKVVAINPDKDKLTELGFNPQKEPQYTDKDKNNPEVDRTRVEFYLKTAPTTDPDGTELPSKIVKAAFWLSDMERTNKDGTKNQFVNINGNFAWPKGDETEINYAWYNKEGLRPAYIGEENLVEMIKAWGNTKRDADCQLESPSKIASGNVTELRDLLPILKDNKFKVLIGVKDGKYQSVYTKHFERSYSSNMKGFTEALEDDYGTFDADYQDDLTARLYTGISTAPASTPTDLASSGTGEVEADF